MDQAINHLDSRAEISNTPSSSQSQHFIDDVLFQRLLAIREAIYKATQVNPSPRKLVNLIIEKADLDTIRDQLIKQYS